MKIGLRGRKSGICTMSGPQIMPARPCIMLPTPSVTITSTITGWPSSGRSSTRSIDEREHDRARERGQHRDRPAEMKLHRHGEEQIGAEHHHLAHGEIEDVARLVDDDEAERGEHIDAARRDADQAVFEELHRITPRRDRRRSRPDGAAPRAGSPAAISAAEIEHHDMIGEAHHHLHVVVDQQHGGAATRRRSGG